MTDCLFNADFKDKENNFDTFCLLSCTPSPFWKGAYCKRKEPALSWLCHVVFWKGVHVFERSIQGKEIDFSQVISNQFS